MAERPGDTAQFHVEEHHQCEPPGHGEIQIRHEAIGTNFLDVYHRKGLYPMPSYPSVIGAEAAGIVDDVGPGVSIFEKGDRVAYGGPPVGAYRSTRNIAAERAIKLPDAVSAKTAASSLLKGMTAYMLLKKTYDVRAGTQVLIHAAAGGLGSILVRWARSLDATVIGTVGSSEKAALAASYGADHLIVGRDADIASTGTGGMAPAAWPMVTAMPNGRTERRPGKALCHPSIMAWCADIGQYREAALAAVGAMETGIVSQIGAEYRLADVAKAHEEMESGRSAGSILLIP